MKKIFQVKGMHCGHCKKRVTELLQRFPGVIRARVSLTHHQATITMDANTHIQAMMDLMEQAGYPLEDIEQ